MYSRGHPQQAMADDNSHNFFRKYNAVINLHTVHNGQNTLRLKNGRVFFTTENRNFDFAIVCTSSDPANTKDKFVFPITKTMGMICEINNANKTVSYIWNADAQLKVILEFEIIQDDFESAIKFRNVITRLLFQVDKKQGYAKVADTSIFESYCPIHDTANAAAPARNTQTPPQVLDAFQKLIKDTAIEFAAIGEMLSVDINQPEQPPTVISPHFIFLIKGTTNQFEYEIQICDENGNWVYKRLIAEELKYYINTDLNTINWMDVKANQAVYLAFRFRDDSSAKSLSVIISMALMQSMKKKKFDDIIKETPDWNQYYGYDSLKDNEEDTTTTPQYDGYMNMERGPVDWDPNMIYQEPASFKDMNHTNLAQGKTIDRTFVTQNNNISVYQAFEDDQFNFVCNLPPVKSLTGAELNPRKLMLTEQDTKVLMLNKDAQDEKVYYMDLEKGKIINELGGKNTAAIADISTYSKNSDMTNNQLFFGCNQKNIFQMDPRVKDSVVMERPYATNYMFNTISGAQDGAFVVGSQDGSLRMYNQCSGNAKNLLPSLLGEPIIHIDTSKDAAFILATCRSHIMLIPTFQDGKSGFSTTFRKDNKPRPIILKVNPKALAKNGIQNLNYSYAIFDNKSQKETLIAANSGPYLILWDLSKVLGGKHDTSTIKSLGDTIVQNQFKYNTDKLIAALPHKLVSQSAKVSKR